VGEEAWELDEALRPPPEVTREMFAAWRAARRGNGNPERMSNPVWEWLARRPEVTAWSANKHFGGERVGGAGWTNQRFGQSTTSLPDGRVLAIAGEHEDYYDPDFFIYNDVLVTAPDGAIEIYGYDRESFPATDFHSATLVGEHVYLIGNLGYSEARRARTQVLRLDVRTLAMEVLEPGGEDPGWISKHEATLSEEGRGILVQRGQCEVKLPEGTRLRENVEDHVLELERLTWTRVSDRRWMQFEVERSGGGIGNLWEIEQLAEHLERPDDAFARQQAAWYRERIEHEPDFAAWRSRFQPPVAHEALPGDDWRVHRIVIDGVTVRYVGAHRGVNVVIEGALPDRTVAAIVEDLRDKLARADAAPYLVRRIDQQG
jgi:hypothetical protein